MVMVEEDATYDTVTVVTGAGATAAVEPAAPDTVTVDTAGVAVRVMVLGQAVTMAGFDGT